MQSVPANAGSAGDVNRQTVTESGHSGGNGGGEVLKEAIRVDTEEGT